MYIWYLNDYILKQQDNYTLLYRLKCDILDTNVVIIIKPLNV